MFRPAAPETDALLPLIEDDVAVTDVMRALLLAEGDQITMTGRRTASGPSRLMF